MYYVIIVVLIIVVLLENEKVKNLGNTVINLENTNKELEDQIYYERNARENIEINKREYSNKKEYNKQNIFENINDNYHLKNSLMNQPEQKAYYYISEIIDKTEFKNKNFFLFSQVNISSFVNLAKSVTDIKSTNRLFYDTALRRITSKSVDFLICERQHGFKNNYYYVPKMAIEFDGPFHRESKRVMENDKFKNQLFNKLGLKLLRVPIQYAYDVDKLQLQYKLEENLLN